MSRKVPIKAVGAAIQTQIRALAPTGMTVQPVIIQVADYWRIPTQINELLTRLPAVIITPQSGDFQTTAPNGAFLPTLGQAQLWWINYLWPIETQDQSQGMDAISELAEMFCQAEQYDESLTITVTGGDGVQLEYAIPGSYEFSDDYATEKLGHAKFGLVVSVNSDLADS